MTDFAIGDGSCVAAVTKLVNGSDEAIFAEALGQLEVVESIERLQIQMVAVEMNAEAIVVVTKQKCRRNYCGIVVKRCIQVLDRNTE
ncbi:unnamed protein product [Trifolium pratense]|uniref:Uncharacterized protein n=1 Tax=Trifolium pratense TaxID=57577 RepID=A0ACB0KHS8_TRIPR|nr:unnamed protein product [Trifolium pratense]